MDFKELFKQQKELDANIQSNHHLEKDDLLDRKLLAFHVELSELANETRCFKFWSKKEPSHKAIVLEEYVDGIHFILSVGLEYGYEGDSFMEYPDRNKVEGEELVPYFYEVIDGISLLRKKGDQQSYRHLFLVYLKLGAALGFNEDEIVAAYESKNQVNHERQEQGY